MRYFLVFLLCCVSCFGQGGSMGISRIPTVVANCFQELYPTNITGLLVWLKSSSSVYKDLGVTLAGDGENVRQWSDLSGNNFHFQRDNANNYNCPVFRTPVTGIPYGAIDFGCSNSLWGGSLTNRMTNLLTNKPPMTMFFVYFSTNNQPSCKLWDGLNPDVIYFVVQDRFRISYAISSSTNDTTSNVWHVVSFHNPSTRESTFAGTYVSRICFEGKSKGTPRIIGTDTAFGTVGQELRIGNDAMTSLDGMIAEIIIYRRALSDAERIGIELYLKKRYAFTYAF